jgi:hypothetical protein
VTEGVVLLHLAEGLDDWGVDDLCSNKRRRDAASSEISGTKKPCIKSEVDHCKAKDYSLRGVTSVFVNIKLDVVKNTNTGGILARSWP